MRFIKKNCHFLLMAAGCTAMLVAVFAFTTITGGGRWGFYLLLLLCPAMHFLMHRGLHDNNQRHQDNLLITPAPVSLKRQKDNWDSHGFRDKNTYKHLIQHRQCDRQ